MIIKISAALRKHLCILFFLAFFTGINVLSWNSKAFTDWYRLHIFPIWTGTLGRVSGLSGGSVGEILIITGVCYVLFGIFMIPAFAWEYISRKKKSVQDTGSGDVKRHKNLRRMRAWYVRIFCWILVYIYGTETLNCFVMYHASTVSEQYYNADFKYGTQELIDAYTEVVTRANALAKQVQRDESGQAVYKGSAYKDSVYKDSVSKASGDTKADANFRAGLYEECKKAMQAQGAVYPYLAGYYPDPKPIRASHFMSQQYLLGIYFPFTMEANYNTVMYPVNVPATICHEFSHLKGIILEDEANYFGFIACIESEEPYLQYSGYLSVLGYLAGQVKKSVPKEMRRQLVQADELVLKDDVFLTKEQWEQVEQKAAVSTETVNKATDAFLEKNLTMNGVEDGIQSYSRVVRLVIEYYGKKGME